MAGVCLYLNLHLTWIVAPKDPCGGVDRFMPVSWGKYFSFLGIHQNQLKGSFSQYTSPRPWTPESLSQLFWDRAHTSVFPFIRITRWVLTAHWCLGSIQNTDSNALQYKTWEMYFDVHKRMNEKPLAYLAGMVFDKYHLGIVVRYSWETMKEDENSVSPVRIPWDWMVMMLMMIRMMMIIKWL